jgi:hypothetical protein
MRDIAIISFIFAMVPPDHAAVDRRHDVGLDQRHESSLSRGVSQPVRVALVAGVATLIGTSSRDRVSSRQRRHSSLLLPLWMTVTPFCLPLSGRV